MPLPVEYRSVIRFLILRHYDSQQIIAELSAAYGDETPSRATIYNWINEFKRGRTDVMDGKSTGRPVEIGDDCREKLEQIVRADRRITKKQLAEELHVSFGTVVNMLAELGIRKLCSRFVPYFLSGEMCERRLQCCQQNLELHQSLGDALVSNIITEDETPLSLYLPEDKRTSAEFKFPGEPASRKLRSGTTHRRSLMLTVFWNCRGIVHMDFIGREQTINAAYYSEQLQLARRLIRKPRNQNLYLLHDNAPVHTAAVSQAAVAGCAFTELPHPPYSPDLAPSDYYLFRHLKGHLRGQRFADKDDLETAVRDFLTSRPANFFKEAFLELPRRWAKCVGNNGGYIEKR